MKRSAAAFAVRPPPDLTVVNAGMTSAVHRRYEAARHLVTAPWRSPRAYFAVVVLSLAVASTWVDACRLGVIGVVAFGMPFFIRVHRTAAEAIALRYGPPDEGRATRARAAVPWVVWSLFGVAVSIGIGALGGSDCL